MMKVNIPVRLKNPWFWIGIASVIIATLGVDPNQFVTWDSVWSYIVEVLRNPVQLVSVVLAVLAIFIDPTTAGISDSTQALGYEKPKKE